MKKILALILASLMLLSFIPAFAEGEAADAVQEEKTPYEMSTEEKILSFLGIIKTEGFDGREPIKRADFIMSVMALCGIGDLGAQATKFSDVPADAACSGAVKAATDMGVIHGFEDGTFRPDNTLTTEQAVKIVLSATGYDVYAISYGGYPGGYLSIAAVNGLLKRVAVGDYEECAWSDASMILYNALTMDLLQQVEYPEGAYKTVEGENPLTKWLGAAEDEGVVTANDITALSSPSSLPEGKVTLDTKQYAAGESDTADFLGYNVKVYYKEDMGEDKIIICVPDKKAKIYKLSSEEISGNTTTSAIEYFSGDKNLKLNISGADFIYNGKSAVMTADKLMVEDGSLTIVDRDGNGKCDTVFAEEYVTYYAGSVTPKSYSITDKFTDEKIVFDFENNDCICKIYDVDGEEIDFSAVKAGHVLSVIQSIDKKYTKIILGTEKVDAAILEISEESLKVDEGAGEYKLASNVKPLASTLEINDVKAFTLTYDGKIGGWGNSKMTGKYGYLITAAALGDGLSGSHQGTFRIFDANTQKIQNFTSAEEIKFNGEMVDENGEKYTGRRIIEKLSDGGVIEDQLIKFVTNEAGEITDFYTANKNTQEPFQADMENFTLDYWLEYAGGKTAAGFVEASNPKVQLGDNPCRNAYYFGTYTWHDNSYGTIDGYISCKNTTMIALPVVPEGKTLMDMEKDISVVNNNWFNSDSQRLRFLYLKVYDMNESRQASILVFRNYAGGSSGTLPNHEHVLVDRVSKALDDDGYETTKIFGYIGNQKVDYAVSSEAVAEGKITAADLNLKRGDVVRLATNPDVIRIVKIFSPAPDDGKGEYLIYKDGFEDWQMTSSSTDYAPVPKPNTVATAGATGPNYDQMSIAIHTRIRKADATGFTFTQYAKRGPTDYFAVIRSGDIQYSVYDEVTDTVRGGTFEDIDPGNPNQTVLMNLSYFRAHEVCIYNWKDEQHPEWKGQW